MAVAAALLPIALALEWYSPVGYARLLGASSLTGWQAFSGLAVLITGCAALGLGGAAVGARLAVRRAAWRGTALVGLVVGTTATLVAIAILRRVLDPPAG